MDDMLQTKGESPAGGTPASDFSIAQSLGRLLDDCRGGDVLVMDMRPLNFWTDFFVIVTATSSTHLSGLERHIKEFARESGVDILHRSRRPKSAAEQQGDEWCLLDMGTIVVHLMSAQARSFFELERLWGAAPLIYQTEILKIEHPQT